MSSLNRINIQLTNTNTRGRFGTYIMTYAFHFEKSLAYLRMIVAFSHHSFQENVKMTMIMMMSLSRQSKLKSRMRQRPQLSGSRQRMMLLDTLMFN